MERFQKNCFLKSLLLIFALVMFSASAFAQKSVTGKVVDEHGEGLPGVNVVEKGTTNGTITDIDGIYHLNVKDDASIIFSFIGYDDVELATAGGTTFNVTMKESTQEIDEVVVVGYGTMKKSDVSGSSITMKAEDMEGFVGSGVDQVLQGKAAGVQVTANSGQPGGGMNVSIRGNGTLSLKNSQPLYVVDGVPIQNVSQTGHEVGLGDALGNGNGTFSGLSNLNPDDIESMEILKDASATAIYGSRAANGVVLITTKKGKKGKANFNYIGTYGIATQPTKLELMNLQEFARYNVALYQESTSSSQPQESYYDYTILGKGVDWQDAIYRTANMQTHQLSASGGTDNVRYYISAGYYDQEGTMYGSDYKRFSTRVNLDANLTPWLKVGTNTSFAKSEDNLGLTNSVDGVLSQAYRMLPDVPVYTIDGDYSADSREGAASKPNPLWKAKNEENKLKRYDLVSNLWSEIKFMEGLTLRTEYSTDYLWSNAYHFEPSANYDGYVNNNNSIRWQSNNSLYWEIKNYITYTKTFFDVHNITAMFGQETSKSTWEYLAAESSALESNDIHSPQLGSNQTIGSGFGSGSRVSLFGRFFYNYDGKYNLTYTYRRDASSNFGPQNRWGNFHSVSASWNAHKEEFFKSIENIVSTARLRIGWGQVGNDNIGSYKWGASGNADFNDLGATYQIKNIPNEFISWETQESWNLGFDFGFKRDRFNLILDFYNKTSKDMLMEMQLPTYMGTQGNESQILNAPSGNFGEINNKGIEITINTVNIDKKGLKWTTDLSFSRNINKLKSLSGSGNSSFYGHGQWDADVVSITKEGEALYQFFGYNVIGVYESMDDLVNSPRDISLSVGRDGLWVGDLKYEDVNKDGKIDENDMTVIGNPFPKFTCGLTNTVTYKGFEFSLFITSSYGNDVLNYNAIDLTAMNSLWQNQLKDVEDRAILKPIDESKVYPAEGITVQYPVQNKETGDITYIDKTVFNWYDDPTNIQVANKGGKMPRAITGDPANNQRISSRYIEDGSYIKIKTLSLAYNIPQMYTKKLKLDAVKVYASVSNLYTFSKYKGLDPEIGTSATSDYVIGLDNGRYPAPRIVTFGLNVSF